MRDLRGYEEKDPEVLKHMPSGYPRFVVHPYVRQLGEHLAKNLSLKNSRLWLCSSEKMAKALSQWLQDREAVVVKAEGVYGLVHRPDPEFAARAKSFLQHAGGFLSSREAEDVLVRLGQLPAPVQEEHFQGDAPAELWRHLSPYLEGAGRNDTFFTSSGINAVYSAFRAIDAVQAARGRRIWIQLGWLYLDTIAILKKFSSGLDSYRHIRQVNDKAALEKLFAEEGDKIAGIIAEVPTNPLIQTPDLPWLAELAHRHGARLVLDPSVASVYSVNLLPYADLLVASLTKYSAHEGDVIAGLAVVNPLGFDAVSLRRELPSWIEPAYGRDLSRLAAQLPGAIDCLDKIEENLWVVARHLEKRPEVSAVHWSRAVFSSENFARVARDPMAVGGMLSFELRVPFDVFYDALRLPKGPSFGLQNSLACPFIWLAHYDLVTSEEGRAELERSHINPNLVRLALGAEHPGDILAALDEALNIAAKAGKEQSGA